MKKYGEIAAANLRSNAQKGQTVRALALMKGERDFDKRAGGVNSQLDDALKGDLDPKLLLSQEKPVHRTMVNLCAAGYTNVEISKITGYSVATVSNAIKQPHAREYLINEAKKTVQDEIKEFLAGEVMPSLQVIKEVRDDKNARNSDRLDASNKLVERFLGKPVQLISEGAKPLSDLSDDELRQQLLNELSQPKPN